MNQLLSAEYKKKEIVEALNSIGPTKASGPDGFPAIFYQKFWHIIGKEISAYFLDILNNGKSLNYLNQTDLVLIPKLLTRRILLILRPLVFVRCFIKSFQKPLPTDFRKYLISVLTQLRVLLSREG